MRSLNRKSVYVCKRDGRVKVKTLVWIDKELFEQVASMAPRVYGVQRGALSLAVEEALRYWLQVHTQPLTRTNPRPTTREVYARVMKQVELLIGFRPLKVRRPVLEQAIRIVRQIRDERSVQRWITSFCDEGLMKPLDSGDPRKAMVFELVAGW
mgnify:CR=1 FL=1